MLKEFINGLIINGKGKIFSSKKNIKKYQGLANP